MKGIHMSQMSLSSAATTRYHRAAIDGYVDMLCDASKRDTNLPSADQAKLTPTLLAAHNGRLEALRILVGRGGDPERSSSEGSSALHLAAANNQLNCVSFLVNFGVNMWALDNELRTAKDVAAIEQNKEVLDYLDQMMARQSALNTKSVQKLKEKAKVAAEKRIKQLRKAQMKAIRQFEKDERYLVKLSTNRRLIKAAHSISDIELVGRCERALINYSPSDLWPANCNSSSAHSKAARLKSSLVHCTSKSSSSSASSASSTSANYVGLLKSGVRRQAQLATTAASNGKPTSAVYSSCNSDESSAYSSSSVSSTSGYLSSCSTSAFSSASKSLVGGCGSEQRPKYSDLVALNQRETARPTRKAPAPQRPSEQQSVKDESTIGTKLRCVVSRKVQLKRPLASADQQQPSAPATSTPNGAQLDAETNSSEELVAEPERQSSVGLNNGQLEAKIEQIGDKSNKGKLVAGLLVQPTIRLRAAGFWPARQPVSADTGCSASIKWPPAPTMSRATSEPDFVGSTLRSAATTTVEATATAVNCDVAAIQGQPSAEKSSSASCESGPTQAGPAANDGGGGGGGGGGGYRPTTTSATIGAPTGGQPSPTTACNASARDESQHELLTKCLSQLKMRHEAITRRQQVARAGHDEHQQPLKPSRIAIFNGRLSAANCKLNGSPALSANTKNSDELLQHQLNAGGFPLRPSLIKQQQRPMRQFNASSSGQQQSAQFARNDKLSLSTTIASADSIGSAGSLAQRNSRSSKSSCESSPVPTSPSSSSSLSSFSCSRTATPSTTKAPPAATDGFAPNAARRAQLPRDQVGANWCEETIESFLTSNGLLELSQVFANERIDLEALMLLTEGDLKSLNILLGPRRKLIKAIERRASRAFPMQSSSSRGDLNDSMYVVVDTPL